MSPLLRDFLLGFVVGAAALAVVAAVRPSEVFSGTSLIWQVPAFGLLGGVFMVVKRQRRRRGWDAGSLGRRLGQRMAGRGEERSEAGSREESLGALWRRSPLLTVVVLVLVVGGGALAVWLRLQR